MVNARRIHLVDKKRGQNPAGRKFRRMIRYQGGDPPMSKQGLVILGSSITALAVARSAYRNRMSVVVVDRRDDVAVHTKMARVEILAGKTDAELARAIHALAADGFTTLIATSDDWLRFIVDYRGELEKVYRIVLHPRNEILTLCLDKSRLSIWCLERGVATPARYSVDAGKSLDETALKYPLLIRPAGSIPAVRALPKAIEVKNRDALHHWLERFEQARVEAVVTESLLDHALTQYSVCLARGREGMVSFVAKKTRPLPRNCAVGSFVELSPNAEVEAMARRIADELDYFGIAEFEILFSHDTRQGYLIEINARPWLQYELAVESGHDFLTFLIAPEVYDSKREVKVGKYWLNFIDDFFNCFSRSVGLVRHGYVGFGAYLFSMLRANVYPKFSIRDPGPAWHGLKAWARTIFRL
jgi:predicted ATP-grasp superfamily ATP-dependent carboligase